MCCPGCPKRGFLLPRIETVTAEEDRSQEPGPGHQEEVVAADVTKEEPDEEEDDLDDLLDDLELNPVIFKKQEDPAKDIVQANRDGDTSEADPGLGGLAWTCADCKMNLAGDKVVLIILCYTPALSKTSYDVGVGAAGEDRGLAARRELLGDRAARGVACRHPDPAPPTPLPGRLRDIALLTSRYIP